MKIAQLKYFQTVCRYSSITKAADELYVSQPAISFCIKELETEFGVKLFHRRNNRLQLTVEGEYFLDKVNYIIKSIDSLASQMKDLGNNRNHIKMAVPAMLSTFLFPIMFNDYTNKFPNVEMEMLETGSTQVRKLVDANSVDLGVTILDSDINNTYNTIPLVSTELMFCVGKTHPLAGRKSLTFRDLADQKLMLFKADSYQNTFIKKAFMDVDIEPRIMLYTSQLYTIKKFLSYGNVGAFLYRQVAELEQDLVCIPMEDGIKQEVVLIWNKHGNLYSDSENFIRYAKNIKFD